MPYGDHEELSDIMNSTDWLGFLVAVFGKHDLLVEPTNSVPLGVPSRGSVI